MSDWNAVSAGPDRIRVECVTIADMVAFQAADDDVEKTHLAVAVVKVGRGKKKSAFG